MLDPLTRFAQNVDAEIRKEQDRIRATLSPSLINSADAATVGLRFSVEVSKMQGLQIALDIMQSVHKDMTGPTKKAKD